jgi:ribosomal protein S18 acetylase RimI-like enzyme
MKKNLTELCVEELAAPCISREIQGLLGYATSLTRTEAEYGKYLEAPGRKLYGFRLKGEIVGCTGIEIKGNQLEIKHIAVLPEARGKQIGTRMIEWIRNKHSPNVIVAETDQEAVGFYRKAGFTAASLGEKYPGTERFWCERKGNGYLAQNRSR